MKVALKRTPAHKFVLKKTTVLDSAPVTPSQMTDEQLTAALKFWLDLADSKIKIKASQRHPTIKIKKP